MNTSGIAVESGGSECPGHGFEGNLGVQEVRPWQPICLGAMAGGMAWGIRGQYGHETGAMIAGLLVSLVWVFLFCRDAPLLPTLRAVAWCTVAIGFGGSMTYGQTVGLTHDGSLTGNWEALRWGLLGLAVKGGIWIGFGGVFLGMGLGGVRYRSWELLILLIAALGLFQLGSLLLNSPYRPADQVLPWIYFSDSWHWEPGAVLKPRRECWGGLLAALATVVVYSGWVRKDRLARNLAFWAVLAGAIGFPLGQSLQAFHAWNPELFRDGLGARFDAHINWWNMMETIFGATFGAVLGLGVWLNRKRIALTGNVSEVRVRPELEWMLIALFMVLLISGEFFAFAPIEAFTDLGLAMGVLPIVMIASGRWWPPLMALPLTVLPIAGKTIQQLVYSENRISVPLGWLVYGAIPLGLMLGAALWMGATSKSGRHSGALTGRLLLLSTWVYFGLNFAFFHFPWPWSEWTSRTPNGIIFTLCAIGITWGVLRAAAIGSEPARVREAHCHSFKVRR